MVAPPLVDMTDLKKGMAASDLPILQDASVHWDGQPIAVVVAETLEQAEHAASLVEVEYKNDSRGSFVRRDQSLKPSCRPMSWASPR